jgi:hypothetical protein
VYLKIKKTILTSINTIMTKGPHDGLKKKLKPRPLDFLEKGKTVFNYISK